MQKKRYEKPAFHFVTDLDNILKCLYEVYGTDGKSVVIEQELQKTIIYPFIRMIQNKCKEVEDNSLHQMLWELYGKYPDRERFIEQAQHELQSYLKEDNSL